MTLAENIVLPLVTFAWERPPHVTLGVVFSREAQNSARAALCRRLAFPAEIATAYEWELFANTPFCGDFTPVEARAELTRQFFEPSVENRTLSFAQFYPELRRIWVTEISNWVSFFKRFCRHSSQFMRRRSSNARTAIVRLQLDVSDLHNGNNAVVSVSFRPGGDWFYKPRLVGHGKTWCDLLSRINRKGFFLSFQIPRITCGGDHHWMEAIQEQPCTSRRQERDFWLRAGALLYLVHCLRGVDFHAGNLVCRADQPIFIDCETLGHPETAMPEAMAVNEKGLFRAGMLPLPTASGDSVASFGSMTLRRISVRQSEVNGRARGLAVAKGFRKMHEFLTEKPGGDAIATWMQQELRRRPGRVIYRPTAHYYSILQNSFSPCLLRNTADRSAFLARACCTPHVPEFISQREWKALRDLDIPFFTRKTSAVAKALSVTELKCAVQIILESVREPVVRPRPVCTASTCNGNNPEPQRVIVGVAGSAGAGRS